VRVAPGPSAGVASAPYVRSSPVNYSPLKPGKGPTSKDETPDGCAILRGLVARESLPHRLTSWFIKVLTAEELAAMTAMSTAVLDRLKRRSDRGCGWHVVFGHVGTSSTFPSVRADH
jgi:hypothetical protein